jgi:hypothetical protein
MSKKSTNVYRITDPGMEPYFIQYDPLSYTVFKKITAEESGRERESMVGHYITLQGCLDSIAEDSIKNQDYDSIASFVEAHKLQINKLQKIVTK